MKKSKLAIFIDSISSSAIICFLFYIWTKRVLKNAFLIHFCLISLFICLFIVFFKYQTKRVNLKNLSNKDKTNMLNCFINITLMNKSELNNFYEKLLSATKITDNYYKNSSSYFFVNLQNNLNKNDLILANQLHQNITEKQPLIFISENFTDEFMLLEKHLPFEHHLYFKDDIYKIIKEKQLLKTDNSKEPTLKENLKNLNSKFKSSLTKNHFKKFFFSGISLIAFSLFVPYSIYYMIIGTILLTFSIMCVFSKTPTSPKPNKTPLNFFIKKDT